MEAVGGVAECVSSMMSGSDSCVRVQCGEERASHGSVREKGKRIQSHLHPHTNSLSLSSLVVAPH